MIPDQTPEDIKGMTMPSGPHNDMVRLMAQNDTLAGELKKLREGVRQYMRLTEPPVQGVTYVPNPQARQDLKSLLPETATQPVPVVTTGSDAPG